MYNKFRDIVNIIIKNNKEKRKLNNLLNSCKDDNDTTFDGLCTFAKCVDVYDGDTCRLKFYYRNEITQYLVRLYGIDTPELRPRKTKNRTEESIKKEKDLGIKAKIELSKKICGKKLIYVKFGKFDKYGRPLVTLFENDKNLNFYNSINNMLIKKKLAVSYEGNKKIKDWGK